MTPRRRGAAAMEFALCLPVLVAVLAAIIDLSMYMSEYYGVVRAARDGARVGAGLSVMPGDDGAQIEAAAIAQARTTLEVGGFEHYADCTIAADWVQIDGAWHVVVSVTHPFRAWFGVIPGVVDGVEGTFTMMTTTQS